MLEEEEDKFLKENPIVFKKYKVKKKLGEGIELESIVVKY
jgi:hypothetical protein